MDDESPGKLVIISGPSGAGKSTVVRRLLEVCGLPLKLSVSATTRAPRPGEIDGQDYHFLTVEEFLRRRENGEFLESKEVFARGDYYGTLRSETASGLSQGKWVILEIDVEGALAVLEQEPRRLPSFCIRVDGELERRLRSRGTDSEPSIQRRLEVARREMAALDRYRYEVVNDTVDRAVQEICEILQANRGDTADA
jgi:guanylate kinase